MGGGRRPLKQFGVQRDEGWTELLSICARGRGALTSCSKHSRLEEWKEVVKCSVRLDGRRCAEAPGQPMTDWFI